jgi:hypothetical protein
MDYTPKANLAKKLLDKFGVAMQVIQSIHGSYIATTDSYASTAVTYDTIGVILNPTMVSPEGIYGKSDRVRLLLNGSALPTLDQIEFNVVYDSNNWVADTVVAVKPGGSVILYIVDVK